MIISERIFQMLREREISQKVFSEQTGIAQSTISDWKRKKTNPAADKILVICEVLGVSPYELLSGVEDEGKYAMDYLIVEKGTKDYILLEGYHSLGQLEQGRLLGYLAALQEKQE